MAREGLAFVKELLSERLAFFRRFATPPAVGVTPDPASVVVLAVPESWSHVVVPRGRGPRGPRLPLANQPSKSLVKPTALGLPRAIPRPLCRLFRRRKCPLPWPLHLRAYPRRPTESRSHICRSQDPAATPRAAHRPRHSVSRGAEPKEDRAPLRRREGTKVKEKRSGVRCQHSR